MIRIIASDMDGTLLDEDRVISKKTIKAINDANKAGIEFIVSSGRSIAEAKPLVTDLVEQPAFITINGAQVFDKLGKEVLKIPIPHDIVVKCSQILIQNKIYFDLITDNGIYSKDRPSKLKHEAYIFKDLNPKISDEEAMEKSKAQCKLFNTHFVPDFHDIIEDPSINVLKILGQDFIGNQDVGAIAKQVAKVENRISITSSVPSDIEINNVKAQKGSALKAFADYQGVPMSEVMAIGDNLNDASMIKIAGYGVAMGNAVPEIKKMANFTTTDNAHDGVGNAIIRAMKLNEQEKQ